LKLAFVKIGAYVRRADTVAQSATLRRRGEDGFLYFSGKGKGEAYIGK
jgi:hypothetical protein